MLTRLRIRNFKTFEDVDIELGGNVLFVGPNNSGKTTALQALALWGLGLSRWAEKFAGRPASAGRGRATINRQDLHAIPVTHANLLWRGKRVKSERSIALEVEVSGVTEGKSWSLGLEFSYGNAESLYCRPAGLRGGGRCPRRHLATTWRSCLRCRASRPARICWRPGRFGFGLGKGEPQRY